MSALSVQAPHGFTRPVAHLRFGRRLDAGNDGATQWLLKRNCSISPTQLLVFFATLCAISFVIAAIFWAHGAPLVAPFAGLELCAVGLALAVYARHAADYERMLLRPGRLTVECVNGSRTDSIEFSPAWVRVEPSTADRSLIELSGEGKRVAVGRFVRPELRRALADELRVALRRCGSLCPPVEAPPPEARQHSEIES
ncbi:MAG: DUF2244 domain-containing protein [Caldimonas sp.]